MGIPYLGGPAAVGGISVCLCVQFLDVNSFQTRGNCTHTFQGDSYNTGPELNEEKVLRMASVSIPRHLCDKNSRA